MIYTLTHLGVGLGIVNRDNGYIMIIIYIFSFKTYFPRIYKSISINIQHNGSVAIKLINKKFIYCIYRNENVPSY